MKRTIIKGLALAGIFSAALGLSQATQAQTFYRAQAQTPSFYPVGGIPGAVANRSAMGLQSVAVINGVPVLQAGPLYQPVNPQPQFQSVGVPVQVSGGVPRRYGEAYCRGFARASDGSLIATSGGGYKSMILGADCDELIQQTLDAGHGVVFSASVLFKGSSDVITLSAKRALKMTAEAINASGGIYEVAGYASREGDRIANDYLSWRRAKAASYYLIRHGVETPHLNIVGKGETTIFGPELAVNRRVVVRRKA